MFTSSVNINILDFNPLPAITHVNIQLYQEYVVLRTILCKFRKIINIFCICICRFLDVIFNFFKFILEKYTKYVINTQRKKIN